MAISLCGLARDPVQSVGSCQLGFLLICTAPAKSATAGRMLYLLGCKPLRWLPPHRTSSLVPGCTGMCLAW